MTACAIYSETKADGNGRKVAVRGSRFAGSQVHAEPTGVLGEKIPHSRIVGFFVPLD
jgi:hypothetical protein